MLFDNFEVKQYEEIFYKDLNLSYKESFEIDFLTKNEYRKRFKLNNEYSSFLLINREKQFIVGHIGFKLNNLNFDIKGKIAFRFSTFIAPNYRGTGLYKYFMDIVKTLLIKKFDVKFIFAWPNINNLISCLKDIDYLNQNPIITWQHYLGNKECSYNKQERYLIEDINKSNFKIKFQPNKYDLTFENIEDLKSTLFNRKNKKYKLILNGDYFFIIGESKINNNIYLSVVIFRGMTINSIISILNQIYNGENHNNKTNCIVQIWCNPKDRFLLGSLLKARFLPNGPIFYNGVYELTRTKFPSNKYFPCMYNHDAF